MSISPSISSMLLSSSRRVSPSAAGFTLLEVMIAVAILAIGLTTLFGSQSQSVSLASHAKFNIRAPQLAQLKLAELKRQEGEMASASGEFEEEFAGYTWVLEVEDSTLGESDLLSSVEDDLKKVTLTISYGGNSHVFQVQSYLLVKSQ